MAKIFISYNRRNETITKTLVGDLQALGHNVWFDQQLSGGQVWWDRILSTIRECDLFVFVLDPESLNSVACKREYGYAADLGKPIVPVLIAEGVSTNLLPSALSQIQFVDYRTQDRNAAFRLARALTAVPPPGPLPEPLPSAPQAPISYLTSLTEKIDTPSSLNYEVQSALLLDLKRSLREPNSADDAYVLLARLRKRRDLLATIAEEIDELLANNRPASISIERQKRTGAVEPEKQIAEPAERAMSTTADKTVQQEKPMENPSNTVLPPSREGTRERHPAIVNAATMDTPYSPSSPKEFGSFVKPAFAVLGLSSIGFSIFTFANASFRNSEIEYIKILSFLYYGFATASCLLGYMNVQHPNRMARAALLVGVILGVGMSFWTTLMEGHRITFDEIYPAWIGAAVAYLALSCFVYKEVERLR